MRLNRLPFHNRVINPVSLVRTEPDMLLRYMLKKKLSIGDYAPLSVFSSELLKLAFPKI
jgi:hypothetical protein